MIDELKYRPLTLRLIPDPVLREKAVPVQTFSSVLKDFANEMLEFMRRHDGIGLAAPQVGILQRIVLVGSIKKPMCLVNPEIETGAKTDNLVEGCLSLPGVEVDVTRHSKVVIRAQDLEGKDIKVKERGLIARVFQHEIDHLNGILICDHGLALTDTRPREA